MSYWGNLWAAVGGKSLSLRDQELYAALGAGETYSGETVNAHRAMQLAAWWGCVKLISETIATLPIGLYSYNADGSKRLLSDHKLYELLHNSPNADQTAVEFWEGRVLGLCTTGNGFAEKMTGAGGRLLALNRMPADTALQRMPDGSRRYRFYDRGKSEDLPEEKVFHLKGFGDGDLGLSPVSAGRQTIGLAIATDRAAGQTFGKGLRAKGFFTMPGKLSKEQRAAAEKALVEPYSGPDGKWAGVLEMGVDFQQVNISPRDAELIASRGFNVEEICRLLGVPPVLIGHSPAGQTMWGSGIEQIMLGWLILGLRPYLKRIEASVNKWLLTPAERQSIFAEFNVEGLLRADSAGRADMYSKLFQLGVFTPNMIADKENFPRFVGGDQHFVNSTFTPIELAGQQAPPPLVRTS